MNRSNGWLWCAAAAVLFGAATPATKLVVDEVGAVTLAGLLYLGAAGAVAPIAVRDRRSASSRRQWLQLLVAVGLGGGLAPVLLVSALNRAPAGTVSLFLNLELVATAVIARLFLREQIGRRAGLGIVIVAAGGVLLAGSSTAAASTGALLAVGACVCWGVDNAITASLDSFRPSQVTMIKGLVAGSVNLALGTTLEDTPALGSVVAALAIGALGYGVSITVWITGARLLGAARGQAVFALAPFIGAVLAWPVNGERLGATAGGAFALSLVGVIIVGTSRHDHGHTHQPLVHRHSFDPSDPHHGPDAIVVDHDGAHRHLERGHDHPHLPDIHHRHLH